MASLCRIEDFPRALLRKVALMRVTRLPCKPFIFVGFVWLSAVGL